jgi:Mg2+ and Co2+ transporter CorA
MRKQLQDLASSDLSDSESWLGSVPDEMERLLGEWDRNVVQRTAALSELMFKSVAFRDARDSLQLGVSMWRLSWITFIFLPLTFTVGFFGMSKYQYTNKSRHNPTQLPQTSTHLNRIPQ